MPGVSASGKPPKRSDAKGREPTITVGGQFFYKAECSIDLMKAPKTIKYVVIEGPTKGRARLGIHEFGTNGTWAKSCFAARSDERPTE
jgi:uncharacterized protein (TIGR03067 family)